MPYIRTTDVLATNHIFEKDNLCSIHVDNVNLVNKRASTPQTARS